MTDTTYWYRYDDVRYAGGCDEWGDPIPGSGHSEIRLTTFKVVGTTPKGVWLSYDGRNKHRWVSHDAYKRFACPTMELAMLSYIARKKKQRSIYVSRTVIVDGLLFKAERELALIRQREYTDH